PTVDVEIIVAQVPATQEGGRFTVGDVDVGGVEAHVPAVDVETAEVGAVFLLEGQGVGPPAGAEIDIRAVADVVRAVQLVDRDVVVPAGQSEIDTSDQIMS